MVSKKVKIILYFSFFLSGIAGLIYEVLWARYLSLIFGNTAYAHSLVLATFMGGLALGSYLLGKRADKIKDQLYFYAGIQIAIAVFCIFTPYFFAASKNIYLAAARNLSLSPIGITIVKFIIGAFIMLPPTILMGGTLPILSKFMTRTLSIRGRIVARLYCINSFGAVIGTLLAGFYLIYYFGLARSITIAATINVLAGGIVFLLNYYKKIPLLRRLTQEEILPEKDLKPYKPETYSNKIIKIALFGIFLSGFVAMLYEVVWIRLISIMLGSSAYSFSLMLAAFISGITIGSFLISKFMPRDKFTFLFFGLCQIFIGILLIFSLPFYERLPFLFLRVYRIFTKQPETFLFYSTTKFLLLFMVIFPPTVFLGMTLPLVSKIASGKLQILGRKVGSVFALNTAGNILGALISGLFLITILGLKNTLEVGIIINLLLGIVILLTDRVFSLKNKFVLVAVCCFVFFGYKAIMPDWNKAYFTEQIYRGPVSRENFQEYSKRIRTEKKRVLFYKDGLDSTVSVIQYPGQLTLYVNGKADASSPGDLPTQIMIAQLPLILKPQAKDVLVVGLGSGITCGSALLHPIESLDLVEISSAVVEANKYFIPHNHNALKDERLNLYIEDARTFLQKSEKKYDTIMSEPSNPWVSGMGSLFSMEFFSDCSRHLKKGGLMIQWVPAYDIDSATFDMIIRTFCSVFPEVQMWLTEPTDIFLIGSNEKIKPNFNEFEKRIAQKQIKEDLLKIGILDLFTLLNQQLSSSENLRKSIEIEGRVNSEYFPILDYMAPLGLYTGSYPDDSLDTLDERRKPLKKSKLLIGAYLKDHKINNANLGNLYKYLIRNESANKKLITPLVEKWYREYPNDNEAILAHVSYNIASLENSIRELEKQIFENKKLVYLDLYVFFQVKKYGALRSSLTSKILYKIIEEVKMCISLSKDKKAKFCMLVGNMYTDIEDYKGSLNYYTKAEELIKSEKDAEFQGIDYLKLLNKISFSYLKCGYPDEATEYAEKVLSIDEDNPRAKSIIVLIKNKS